MTTHSETNSSVTGSYYYLWHLAALGIIDADYGPTPRLLPDSSESAVRENACPSINGTVWESISGEADGAIHPAKVFLIDVGVSRQHPNLASRIDGDLSIDLTSHRFGARFAPIGDDDDGSAPEDVARFFTGLDITGLGQLGLSAADESFLDALVEELEASSGVVRRMVDTDEVFASHGTSIAGLIVGEPAAFTGTVDAGGGSVTLTSESAISPEAAFGPGSTGVVPGPNENLLPYFGADPFSRLVSLRTSFEPDPAQFISAFLYCWLHGADVIVMPRGLPDPVRSRLEPKEELKAELEHWENRDIADLFERIAVAEQSEGEIDPKAPQPSAQPDRMWHILQQIIIAVSKMIPIVVAAGNDGESQLIYPASLADRDNGIIAVGAVSAEGFRSGYSNYGEGLTLVAPSDDAEVYNRHQLRIDRRTPTFGSHHYDAGNGQEYAYSHLDLMTTDLPGAFGYEGGDEPWSSLLWAADNPGVGGGYYTSFGGTSGACALAGGVAALVQRAHKVKQADAAARLDGVAVKELLIGASSTESAVSPGYRPLTPDTMNHHSEDVNPKSYFFGAGLLDARAAVAAILDGN